MMMILEPCPCLGVFGMSLNTTERELKHIFGKYGDIGTSSTVTLLLNGNLTPSLFRVCPDCLRSIQ